MDVFGPRRIETEVAIDVAPEDNPTNEPEPDIIVLKRNLDEYETNPTPRDLHLVVEIADTTLYMNLRTKAALYARAGIVEYWVFDISGRRMIVDREPKNGSYQSVVGYGDEEKISCLAAPDEQLRVGDAFPAPKEKGSK